MFTVEDTELSRTWHAVASREGVGLAKSMRNRIVVAGRSLVIQGREIEYFVFDTL